MSQKLYEHQPHTHQPADVNERHAAERLSLNDRIAVRISQSVGTMVTAYVFAGIGIASLVGAVTQNALLALTFGALSSYFLQLVLLPIIMVGQNVQSRHGELVAEESYHTARRIFHETDQLVRHLHAQDALALQQSERLDQMITSVAQQEELLGFLLDHFGIQARFDTQGHLPVVHLDSHRISVDPNALRIGLIESGMVKAEVAFQLDVVELLTLDRKRPHAHEETSHETLADERPRPLESGAGAAHGAALRADSAD